MRLTIVSLLIANMGLAVLALYLSYFSSAFSLRTAAERVINASPYAIAADDELSAFVLSAAEAAIGEHCTSCHGADLAGRPGVPDLVDYDCL